MLRIGVLMYQTSLTKGQELVAQRMVKEFRRQGHDAFLITSLYHDGQPVGPTTDEVKKRGGYIHLYDHLLGVPVIRLCSGSASWPPRRISFEDFVGTLEKIVEELELNVLITHSTLWNGPEEVVKFVKWRRKMIAEGAPYRNIIFCHMSHFQDPSGERYMIHERSFRDAWNSAVLPQVLGSADLILVTTPYEGDTMKTFGATSDKLLLFPGGVDDAVLESTGDGEEFRQRLSLGNGVRIVSYFGSVEERKNALAVLEVARALRERVDLHFVIAGRLEGDYGLKVKEEGSKLNNVSVVGALSDEDKAKLIRSSFINISLSTCEALGIAQLEFMSAGVPVVSSGVGGQSWIVRSGFNGVVVKGPGDLKGATDAVLRLSNDVSRRNTLGRNGARFASQFSVARLVGILSKRLETELQKHHDATPPERIQGDERVLEAWAQSGLKIAATSQRLIIRSARTGRRVLTIPYGEMRKIVRWTKVPWPVFGIGAFGTAVLLVQRAVGLGILSRMFGPAIALFSQMLGHPELGSPMMALLPLLPLVASTLVLALTLKEGFMLYYGQSGKRVFIPKGFVNTLKLADRLTPNELFVANIKDARN